MQFEDYMELTPVPHRYSFDADMKSVFHRLKQFALEHPVQFITAKAPKLTTKDDSHGTEEAQTDSQISIK